MDQIVKLLEDEIDKRVNERLSVVLERISRTYDISMRQLMRDLDAMPDAVSTCCKGLTGKGKRCSRTAKTDGYCHMHIKQKPVQRVTRAPVAAPSQPTLSLQHTHTLPPLFMSGCPACEKSRSTNNLSLLAMCV